MLAAWRLARQLHRLSDILFREHTAPKGMACGIPTHQGETIMAESIKGKVGEAGHKVVETAKTVGHKIAEGAEKATDWP